jgi:hypothetical protein
MAGFVVVMIVALFLGGVVTGVVVVVALAVRREDRHNTLAGAAPGLLASSARRLNGVGSRGMDAEFLRPTMR